MSWIDEKNHCAGCGEGVMGFYCWRPNEWLCGNCLHDWEAMDAENRLEETDEREAQ
tara:strand:- start:320 stop:487 length:168 start_codon:yes stop_codon:yes gene_type:complete